MGWGQPHEGSLRDPLQQHDETKIISGTEDMRGDSAKSAGLGSSVTFDRRTGDLREHSQADRWRLRINSVEVLIEEKQRPFGGTTFTVEFVIHRTNGEEVHHQMLDRAPAYDVAYTAAVECARRLDRAWAIHDLAHDEMQAAEQACHLALRGSWEQ